MFKRMLKNVPKLTVAGLLFFHKCRLVQIGLTLLILQSARQMNASIASGVKLIIYTGKFKFSENVPLVIEGQRSPYLHRF